MSNVANKQRIADETLSAIKLDTVLAQKTGVSAVSKPNSYDKTAVITVKKVGLIGGVQTLIKNNTKINAGVSSFDDKWLPKGETMIINGITVLGSASDDSAVDPANAVFGIANNLIEPALRSAIFRVVQGGVKYEAPIERIAPVGTPTSGEDIYVPLVKPILLLPETPFNFEIEAALGATPLAGTPGYLKFLFDVTIISTNNVRQGSAC